MAGILGSWFGGNTSVTDPNGLGNLTSLAASPTITPTQTAGLGGATPAATTLGSTVGGNNGWLGISGLGANVGTAQLGLQGLQTLGGLWNAYQANSLANKQFQTAKDFANVNLNNSIKSYNTQLTDRATTRGMVNGTAPGDTQAYIAANQLSR